MELLDKLKNCTLREIKKMSEGIVLVFVNNEQSIRYRLSFIGFLFETPFSPVGKRVDYVSISNTLGFKAHSQLDVHRQDSSQYKQLFFKMTSPNENIKVELVCAVKDMHYKIIKSKK